MILICDVNDYRKCASQFQVPLVNQLFNTLHDLCNLLVVPPENIRQISNGERLIRIFADLHSKLLTGAYLSLFHLLTFRLSLDNFGKSIGKVGGNDLEHSGKDENICQKTRVEFKEVIQGPLTSPVEGNSTAKSFIFATGYSYGTVNGTVLYSLSTAGEWQVVLIFVPVILRRCSTAFEGRLKQVNWIFITCYYRYIPVIIEENVDFYCDLLLRTEKKEIKRLTCESHIIP